jgi:hypothetical protein
MSDETLKDRLARLTFLCSELHAVTRENDMTTQKFEEILAEAESLCAVLRKELKRRSPRPVRSKLTRVTSRGARRSPD